MTWGEFKRAVDAAGVKDEEPLRSVEWWDDGWANKIDVKRHDPDDAVSIE